MNRDRNVVEGLLKLFLYAIVNIDEYYSRKAMEMLRKISSGFVIVSSFNSDELPFCGLACSIGLGGFGIVFVNRELLSNPSIPEELKEFVIAHELAHIVRNHLLSRIFLNFLTRVYIQILNESMEHLMKIRNLVEGLLTLIGVVFLFGVTLKLTTEVDPQLIKQEELEADSIAIDLAGCRGALIFADVLKWLKSQGYSVSHESMFGFPALTVDERINFIRLKCQDNKYVTKLSYQQEHLSYSE